MNYSPNIFKSSGRWYTLNITIVPDLDMFPDDTPVSLDGLGIDEFSYASELNRLVMTGKIVYIDRYGQVDKFLEQQQCICQVMFAQNKTSKDGVITDSQIDKDNAFVHTFIVTNMKIIKRERENITYEIDLVSQNWYSCISNIAFSNHDSMSQPVFKILKTCIQDKAQLKVGKTFDEVKTAVSLDYATQANDNLFSVFQYLMDKLYFWKDKDNALKFLVYNWYKDEYELLDITNEKTFMGMSSTLLSFFKSNAEQLVQANESNIGSYSNGKSKTDLYKAMISKRINYYDFAENKFKVDDKSADDKALTHFMNEHVSYDDFQLKYHDLALDKTLSYVDNSSYWNNAPEVYFSMVESMHATGGLALNTTGEIMRQCGFGMNLAIDRSMTGLIDTSAQDMKDVKTKYIGFEGTWLAFKVISVICPREELFRQKIALFRNYTKREKPPKETVV